METWLASISYWKWCREMLDWLSPCRGSCLAPRAACFLLWRQLPRIWIPPFWRPCKHQLLVSGGGRESMFSVLISSVYVLKKHSTILFLCVFFIDSMAEGVGVQPSFQFVSLPFQAGHFCLDDFELCWAKCLWMLSDISKLRMRRKECEWKHCW